MVNQARLRCPRRQGTLQGRQRQLGVDRPRQAPSDTVAGVCVEQGRQIDEGGRQMDVGDIGGAPPGSRPDRARRACVLSAGWDNGGRRAASWWWARSGAGADTGRLPRA
jgi:hypothetical protein